MKPNDKTASKPPRRSCGPIPTVLDCALPAATCLEVPVTNLATVGLTVVLSALAQVPASPYLKGDIVILAPQANGDPLPDSRIVAIAGDRIQITPSAVLVNGEPVAGVSKEMFAHLTSGTPWDEVIPEGHYVVLGERQVTPASTVRYHGLIPTSKIVGRAPSR
jgi:signal peptidase I